MHFLLAVISDGTETDAPAVGIAIDRFNDRLRADKHWVFGGGLTPLGDARTIDNRSAKPMITDGPFTESKEFIAGFWVIEAADLKTALALGTAASKACDRKIEVRPFGGVA
jgi:hypothetical protein